VNVELRIRFNRGTTAACLLSLALHLLPAAETAAADAPSVGSLDTLRHNIDSVMSAFSIPGAAVALVSRDSIIWISTFGFANQETGERVSEDTHFCIGSCTKSILGMGLLKLLDEGRIDLNAPVRDVVPEVDIDNPWERTHPVRVIHLLEHTAGFDDSYPNSFYIKGPVLPLRSALEAKAHLRKVRWPPGTRFAYSSPGFTLAGYILEKASGQPYGDYLKRTLLEPIGMKTSTIGSSEEFRRQLAVGYGKDNLPFPVWYDCEEPAGAMNSSIQEMAMFVQFLLRGGAVGGAQIVPVDLMNRIGKPTTTTAARAGLSSGYGFGIGTRYRGGAKWYSHSGAVPGFLSEYACNIDRGLGFVVLQNSFDVLFHDDVFVLVRRFAESYVDSAVPPPAAPVPPGQLAMYCGYYEPRSPRMRLTAFVDILVGGVTVVCKDDTLYSQGFMEDPQSLIPVSGQLFRRPEQPEATSVFTHTSDGGMVFATHTSYYERTASWQPYLYRTLVFGAAAAMMSTFVYAVFWIPMHVYKRLRNRADRSQFLAMRVVPLLAVMSLILGVAIMVVSQQSILQLGQRTPANVALTVSTWLFAAWSALSLFTSYRSFSKPVAGFARVYAVIVSAACFGMTLYLAHWGLMGLRLWAY
jgi:CubicO group peptidase (beta-lactamase class C family)